MQPVYPHDHGALVPLGQYPAVYHPMRCSVCCQQAFGMNYGVPSCNACKMFFRRVILLNPEYTCRGNGTCYRQIESLPDRPKCRSCRFKRCLEVGMRYRGEGVEEEEEIVVTGGSTDQAHHPPTNTLVTPMDRLCSMIQSVLVLDSHRYESLERMRSEEDPTIRELISRSVRGFAVDRMGENALVSRNSTNEQILSQWSFFGLWTSIEFLNSLEFMSLLSADDKTIILKSYAMNSYLLSSAFQSVSCRTDRMINPDMSETFSERLRSMPKISADSVNRVQKLLVAKLREIQITPEEYILTMLVLFCTPQTNDQHLSAYAREIVSEQQRKYCNALMEYCMMTRKDQGPTRFQKIISIGGVLAKSFEDVHHLVTMLQIFHPTSHNSKKLFVESLNK